MRTRKTTASHLGTGFLSSGSCVLSLLTLPTRALKAALRLRRSMCEPACWMGARGGEGSGERGQLVALAD